MNDFKYGNRVVWSYFTGRFGFSVKKEKAGCFISYVRHTRRYYNKSDCPQLALVKIDGNGRLSRVPVCELSPETPLNKPGKE